MSKWSEKYREKLKELNKNTSDFEEEELLQQEKWCALTEILDEYEEDISILQHNYDCKNSENNIIHKRLKLLTHYLKLQGHTDAQINEIIKFRGE